MDKKNIITLINKIIKHLYFFLFFFTPLIMCPLTSELFEFNKMLFIYLVATFIAFFWFLKMILLKKIILKKTPLDCFIFIFLLSQIVSTFFSIDFHTSFFGYYGRFNGGLLSIFTYIILFYGFVSNFSKKTDEDWVDLLLKTSLISSTIVILWGLPGKFGHDLSCLIFTGRFDNSCWTEQFRPAERMFSTLGQPNWLGAYLAINFFIALYYFYEKKFENKSLILIFYLFLNFSTILFTRSRSAFVAVIFGLSFFLIYIFFARKFFIKKKVIILIAIVIFPILIFKTGINKIDKYLNFNLLITFSKVNKIKDKNSSQIKNYFSPKIKITESFDIRKIVWKGAIELGKLYPFFGTGVETFAYAYYFVRPKEHNLTSEWDYLYNKAHNEYLNYLATTGFFGLGSYLIMIFGVLAILFSNIYLFLAYFSILITNFFGFSTTTINLFFYLMPAFLLTTSDYLEKEKEKNKERNKESIDLTAIQKLSLLISSIFTFYFLFFIFKYWLADYYYAKSDLAFKANQYQLAAFYIKDKALKLKYEHVYEDKLSYILANLAFLSFYQKEKNLALSLKNLSIFYNNHSLSKSPKNVLYWKTKAKIYYLFYQMDLDPKNLEIAISALKQAQKLSPTDPKISYTLAFFYSVLYDEIKETTKKQFYKQKSIQAINYTIELKNDMVEAYLLKGQLLKKYKNIDEAKKTFQYILQNLDPQNEEAKKELIE